jgi:MtrB/PioB family decaheme-associated outer membrane protein
MKSSATWSTYICPVYVAVWLVLPAHADENSEEWHDLVAPANQIEIGLGALRDANASFANATGLNPRGGYVVAGFGLASSAPPGGELATRWRLQGRDLGLTDYALTGEYGQPGQYRLSMHFDQIRDYGGDGYETPFQGIGGRHLTLPEGLAQAATNPQTGAAPLMAAMHEQDLSTTRQRARLGARAQIAQGWEFQAGASQDRLTGTRASGATLGSGGSSIAMILPEPVEGVIRRVEASLAYQRTGSHLRLDYRGSFFNNDIDAYTFQSPFSIANTLLDNRMGVAPDNQSHTISLGGAYNFGATARLNASLAYGRLTQDADFLPYSTAPGTPALPRTSLDGEVVTRQARVKLVTRPTRDLRLNVGYRHDERDNRTPVATYTLPGVSSAGLGEVGAANVTLTNTPYSRETSQSEIEASWAVGHGRDLNLTLSRDSVARSCHGETDCVEVPDSEESAWRLEWRQDINAKLSARLRLSEARRRGDEYTRYAESIELAGMRKFFLADRDRGQMRARLHADINDALALDATLDINHDRYMNSPYGLQSSDSRAFNLDLGYVLGEDLSLNLFAGRETLESRLASSYASSQAEPGVTAELPDASWRVAMDDTVDLLGLGLKQRGWPSARIDIETQLVLVRARSPYLVTGGTLSAGATPMSPEPLPKVRSDSLELRLAGRYTLDARSGLRVVYLYRRMSGDDYALDLYSLDSVPRLLGTEEQTPAHHAHALAVSYETRLK